MDPQATTHPIATKITRLIGHRISPLVNRNLAKVGLTLLRPGLIESHSSTVNGMKFAYELIMIMAAENYAPWALDDAFQSIYRIARNNTLVDQFRCYELYDLVRETRAIEGDILEVGVWRGGTGAVLAAAAKSFKDGAKVYLCDTFEGIVKAGAHDTDYKGGEHADASLDIVEALLRSAKLNNYEILEGIFPEESSGAISDRAISFCHIDVDVYQSALDIVNWVHPRMPAGGVIVFDDYSNAKCPGITRLVNELRATGAWFYIYNLNGHAILIRK